MKFLISLIVLFPTLLFAQFPVDYVVSEPFRDAKRSGSLYKTFTTDQNQIVLVRNAKKQILIDVYSEDFTPVLNKSIERDRMEVLFGSMIRGNELILISVYYPNSKERVVTTHLLNLSTGDHKTKTLLNKTLEKTGKLLNLRINRQTMMAVSRNNQYFVIGMDDFKENVGSFELIVFDTETLERQYRQNSRKSGDAPIYIASDLMIDNDGVVYLLGKEYERGEIINVINDADRDYLLTRADAESVSSESIDLGSEQHVIALRLLDAKNHVRAVGLYGKRQGSKINGTVVFTHDKKDLSMVAEKRSDIPKEIYDDLFHSERAERRNKKQKGIRNTYINYIKESEDGTIYLSAQEYSVTNSTDQNRNSMNHYHYGNILHFSINPVGELNWGRAIRFSYMLSEYALNHLYHSIVTDGSLYVVLNGYLGKEERISANDKGRGVRNALLVYRYDNQGEVERAWLFNNTASLHSRFAPQYGAVTSNGQFVTLNRRRGQRRFIMIRF